MSLVTQAWDALYRVHTRTKGVAIVATVGTLAVAKPAILTFVKGELVGVRERKQPNTYTQPNYDGWKRRHATQETI